MTRKPIYRDAQLEADRRAFGANRRAWFLVGAYAALDGDALPRSLTTRQVGWASEGAEWARLALLAFASSEAAA